jgi:hypothetical protein
MQPFAIRLTYCDRHWLTVTFELGHDEVGSTQDPDDRMDGGILDIFATLGLEEPQPVPLMKVEHQVAEKLHACTYINPKTGGNQRAHDLVDIQILGQEEEIDFAELANLAPRLFAARRAHDWPPTVVEHPEWPTLYREAAEGLDVITDVSDAVVWANELVSRIVTAGKQ